MVITNVLTKVKPNNFEAVYAKTRAAHLDILNQESKIFGRQYALYVMLERITQLKSKV